jgi:ATP-dependent protease ClpP protease subunit
MLSGEVNDDMANTIIAQLLFLDAQDSEKDIYHKCRKHVRHEMIVQ